MTTSVPQRRMSRAVLAYAAAFAEFEGFDQLSFGVTVPSLLEDAGMKASSGAAPAVLAAVLTALVPVARSRTSTAEPGQDVVVRIPAMEQR